MTSQHPTIPGVTVEHFPAGRILRFSDSFGGENCVEAWIVTRHNRTAHIVVNPGDDRFVCLAHDNQDAETLAAVILDQAQWLREAGQCD